MLFQTREFHYMDKNHLFLFCIRKKKKKKNMEQHGGVHLLLKKYFRSYQTINRHGPPNWRHGYFFWRGWQGYFCWLAFSKEIVKYINQMQYFSFLRYKKKNVNACLRKSALTFGSCPETLCFMKWSSSLQLTRLHIICTRRRSTTW